MFRTAYHCRFLLLWILVLCVMLALPFFAFGAETTATTPGIGSSYWGWLSNPVTSAIGAGFDWIVLQISWLFLQVIGYIFGIVGALFDYAVLKTITQFGTFYADLKAPIEGVWSSLRDLANIAIIGAFVFVAISTILGVQAFGYQKFLAKLIIVAILINFSLFFSKLAIDVSHVFANQFYNAMAITPPGTNTGTTNVNGTQVASTGIAGAFSNALGVATWSGSADILKEASKNGGTFRMFVFALASASLLLFAMLVFAYAIVLLIARGATLIFLVMLSGLAFATLAIPKLDNWWGMWYRKFIENLFFAPAFMAMMWASLAISQKMAAATTGKTGATLASIATSPSGNGTAGIIFNYLIIIGLLIGSIQIAKRLSVYGAKRVPSWDALAKFGGYQLPGRLTGLAGKTAIGIPSSLAYRFSSNALSQMQRDGDSVTRRMLGTMGNKLLQTGYKSSFNPALAADAVIKKLDKNSSSFLNSGKQGGMQGIEDTIRKGVIGIESSSAKVQKEAAADQKKWGERKAAQEKTTMEAALRASASATSEDKKVVSEAGERAYNQKLAPEESKRLKREEKSLETLKAIQEELKSSTERAALTGKAEDVARRDATQARLDRELRGMTIEAAETRAKEQIELAKQSLETQVRIAERMSPEMVAKAQQHAQKEMAAVKAAQQIDATVKKLSTLKGFSEKNVTDLRSDVVSAQRRMGDELKKAERVKEGKEIYSSSEKK